MSPVPRPAWLRYGVALLTAVVATALRSAFDPLLRGAGPFIFVYPALTFAAWFGGFGPGLLTTAAATLLAGTFFVQPRDAFFLANPAELPRAAIVVVSGVAISALCHALHRNARAARLTAEDFAASQAHLRAIIDQVTVGICEIDLSGRFLAANDCFCQLVARTPDQLRALRMQDITANEDLPANLRLFNALVAGGPSYVVEKRYTRPDGSHVWVSASVVAIRDAHADEPRHITAVVIDITQRKLAELELQRAKHEAELANGAKDQFLAVLSHELRTPLTPVLATVESLADEPDLPPEVRDALHLVQRNVELEARLIDDLLDLTRITRGKVDLRPARVDAHAALRNALAICDADARAKSLHLATELHARHAHVTADAARLQQVLWNLLKNAVKFTPPGGHVVVRSEIRAPGELAIDVRDSGIGIDPALLPRLFNAFEQGGRNVTRQFGGLGLGLAISKALVDAHGGRLTAHSDGPHCGATLTLTLPLAAPATDSTGNDGDAPPAPAAATPKPCRILLVEDHADTALVMSRLLARDGHTVETAGSVAAALESATRADFDLLISDLGLPDGTGADLLRQLLPHRHPLPAIALSGYGMDDDVQNALTAGFHAHLTKPVNVKRLNEVIATLFPPPTPDTASM